MRKNSGFCGDSSALTLSPADRGEGMGGDGGEGTEEQRAGAPRAAVRPRLSWSAVSADPAAHPRAPARVLLLENVSKTAIDFLAAEGFVVEALAHSLPADELA